MFLVTPFSIRGNKCGQQITVVIVYSKNGLIKESSQAWAGSWGQNVGDWDQQRSKRTHFSVVDHILIRPRRMTLFDKKHM